MLSIHRLVKARGISHGRKWAKKKNNQNKIKNSFLSYLKMSYQITCSEKISNQILNIIFLPSIGLLQAKTWIGQSESCIFQKVSNRCTAVTIWTSPQWIWWEQASVCCENRQRRTGIICSGFTREQSWKFMHTHLETMALTNRPQTVRYLQQNAILRWCKHLPTCFVLQHEIPGLLFRFINELDIYALILRVKLLSLIIITMFL